MVSGRSPLGSNLVGLGMAALLLPLHVHGDTGAAEARMPALQLAEARTRLVLVREQRGDGRGDLGGRACHVIMVAPTNLSETAPKRLAATHNSAPPEARSGVFHDQGFSRGSPRRCFREQERRSGRRRDRIECKATVPTKPDVRYSLCAGFSIDPGRWNPEHLPHLRRGQQLLHRRLNRRSAAPGARRRDCAQNGTMRWSLSSAAVGSSISARSACSNAVTAALSAHRLKLAAVTLCTTPPPLSGPCRVRRRWS
jgi:hypothetical protein